MQVPVEEIEAAVVRHYTSRAGDPHRHLHLQINARVWAAGRWRGIHTVGVRDSLDAINGIGHAAVMCDPGFRAALARHGYSLDPASGEVAELAPYVGRVQRQDRADPAQRRALRGRVASRPPAPGTRPQAPAGLGPARLGHGPARQGRPPRRRRARDSGGSRSCTASASSHHRTQAVDTARRRDAGGSARPGRAGRDGADAARQQAVGVERGGHPRRDGAADRRRRRRHRSRGPARAGRGPHRPRHRSLHPAPGSAPMSPSTSDPSPHHRSSRSRTASPPRSPLAPSSRSPPGTPPSRRRSTTHRGPSWPR